MQAPTLQDQIRLYAPTRTKDERRGYGELIHITSIHLMYNVFNITSLFLFFSCGWMKWDISSIEAVFFFPCSHSVLMKSCVRFLLYSHSWAYVAKCSGKGNPWIIPWWQQRSSLVNHDSYLRAWRKKQDFDSHRVSLSHSSFFFIRWNLSIWKECMRGLTAIRELSPMNR